MKTVLGLMLGLVAIAIIGGLVLSPVLSNVEAQAERARAARIAEETRLEQARAATVQVQADAFGLKSMALLPWGLLVIGVVFVGTMLVVLVFRPHQATINRLEQVPPQYPQIGSQGPVYFVQGPNETPEMFLLRVAMQVRQIEAPTRTTR